MGPIVQIVDILELLAEVEKNGKKTQAIFLQNLEQLVEKDSREFAELRKLFLDASNEHTRFILRTILGSEFENVRHTDRR